MLVLSFEVISGLLILILRISEGEETGLSLAVVRELRDVRSPAGPDSRAWKRSW